MGEYTGTSRGRVVTTHETDARCYNVSCVRIGGLYAYIHIIYIHSYTILLCEIFICTRAGGGGGNCTRSEETAVSEVTERLTSLCMSTDVPFLPSPPHPSPLRVRLIVNDLLFDSSDRVLGSFTRPSYINTSGRERPKSVPRRKRHRRRTSSESINFVCKFLHFREKKKTKMFSLFIAIVYNNIMGDCFIATRVFRLRSSGDDCSVGDR